MNPANRSRFVYVTYIGTTPGKLWKALTDPQLIRQYRFDTTLECEVKLTITHEIDQPNSPFITAVSDGWPRILSNLKSLLETGKIICDATFPIQSNVGR